jgi:hypothetical protein
LIKMPRAYKLVPMAPSQRTFRVPKISVSRLFIG